MKHFYYLASHYTTFPAGIDAAYEMAAKTSAALMEYGLAVFSPILHNHPLAKLPSLEFISHRDWLGIDEAFMEAACGIIVHCSDNWCNSEGISEELAWFRKRKRTVLYNSPGGEFGTAKTAIEIWSTAHIGSFSLPIDDRMSNLPGHAEQRR